MQCTHLTSANILRQPCVRLVSSPMMTMIIKLNNLLNLVIWSVSDVLCDMRTFWCVTNSLQGRPSSSYVTSPDTQSYTKRKPHSAILWGEEAQSFWSTCSLKLLNACTYNDSKYIYAYTYIRIHGRFTFNTHFICLPWISVYTCILFCERAYEQLWLLFLTMERNAYCLCLHSVSEIT